ncbi:predicted protein [Uncinocarpus reesii 1704]|uniref:Uncharacterized protein n=1 Tax=Uncinocarpus reesii (strain UAMH 1704) TaxID=336963 RepID=C4JWC5_UNCRE|nr:uncharacterized protein UREG_06867 [Uncinocarpus reesii 1704]EEP82002.1 predicted protein [Uncinocarpus reesii 1704]
MSYSDALTLALDDPLPVQNQILNIIYNYLPPNSSTSLEDTARKLDQLHPDKRPDEPRVPKESSEDFVYSFWEPFHMLARLIPQDHPAMDMLVQLIIKLRDMPSRQVHLQGWGDFALWADLPLFGETFSTAYDVE